MTSSSSSSPPLKRPRPPPHSPSPSNPGSHLHTNKRIKLHDSTSKLESILSSLYDFTSISHHQVNSAQKQLDSLRAYQTSLERENQSLRSSLKEERSSHQLTKKDWEMAQSSVRRLRKENDILLRKYSKVDDELAQQKEKYERAREKLEKEVKDHLTTTKELSRVKEEITLLKTIQRPEVSNLTNGLGRTEKESTNMEKENEYLIRKNMDLEVELEKYEKDKSMAVLKLLDDLRDVCVDKEDLDMI
ncbi:hypothetical protein V866_008594 [Kwoniella sp. B9012]